MNPDSRPSHNKQPHSHNQFLCDICYNQFNKSSRIPLFICPRQHQVCSYCIMVIRESKKCPFCREPLDFNNIKINKKLVNRLTYDPQEPNVRYEILQQSNFFVPPPQSSEGDQVYINEDIFLQMQDQDFQRFRRMEETERKRIIIHIITLFFLLPFFILDLYSGYIKASPPQCSLTKNIFGFLNLNLWFRLISILQGGLLISFLFVQIRIKCHRGQLYVYSLSPDEGVYCMAVVIKGLLCLVVELALFFGIIVTSCNGHIYTYGVSLAVIHILKAAIISSAVLKNSCC